MKNIKIILAIIFLLSINLVGQVFDEPLDSTSHYNFRLYKQSARVPNTILNEDKEKIDSLIYDLIVWTDSVQFVLIVDTNITTTPHLVLKISNYATGIDTFTTTATVDTIILAGADTLNSVVDLFWLQPYGTTITSNDVLGYYVIDPDTLIVIRPASGTSGLVYVWRWIKRY